MKTERVSNLMFPKRPARGMKFVASLVFGTAMVLAFSTGAWAILHDRGGGLIYDDFLNVTWLQDANLAESITFGVPDINADGTMSWNTAQAWIAAMNAAAYLGYSDWRLPITPDAGGPFVFGWDGVQPYSYNYGYNMTTSEMGYMFYVNLLNVGSYPTNYNGTNARPPGTFGLINVGPFQNFGQPFPDTQAIPYWSGTLSINDPTTAWYFDFYFGNLNPGSINPSPTLDNRFYAWAVRTGDVAPVAESISIDIKPGSDPNSINPKSKGKIPVAILSTEDFDASSELDQDSLTFGSTGEEDSLAFCNPKGEDVNGDGLIDLVCHFYTQATGFQCGDTEGLLKGETVQGTPIEGSDSVRIVPCH